MSVLRLGSLCTGYGGLDLAVADVLDVQHAWVSDVCKFGPNGAGHHDPCRAPCTILAHRFPDVPNLGDLTKIDWATVPPIEVLTAGYPCQPFSHAGRRRGTDDPRHLWPFIREAIRVLRPRLTFLENVDGHRSLGFDRVVGDMAEDGMHVRWVVLPASGVGAPHQRKRLFIAITPDADDLGLEWGGAHGSGGLDLRTAVQNAEREGWGAEGHAAAGEASRGRASAVTGGSDRTHLMPTPERSDGSGGRRSTEHGGKRPSGAKRAVTLATAVDHLMPTPRAGDGEKGGPNQRGSSGDLMLPSAVGLLPTPTARDHKCANQRGDDICLTGALLPTPAVNDMGAAYTPETWDAWTARMKAKHANGNGHGDSLSIEAQRVAMLPTPKASLFDAKTSKRAKQLYSSKDSMADVIEGNRWGKYAAAIARWEHITRPAPDPTSITAGYLKARAKRLARQDRRPVGMRGTLKVRRQLAAVFSEWMMGLPLGWITDVPGITRNEALKAAGNGVVRQQAAEGLRYLLAMPTGRQIAACAQPNDLLEFIAMGGPA